MRKENENDAHPSLTPEERHLRLEEQRVKLDQSFAKKWLPTLAVLTVAFVAGIFGYVQQSINAGATDRATIEAKKRSEFEWGFKTIELYVTKQDEFNMAKDPERASKNLQALAAVAPDVVKGLLNAELSKIPAPTNVNGSKARLDALAGVATVQAAIAATESHQKTAATLQASSFTVYLQFPEGGRDTAGKVQASLIQRGYKVPGIEQVQTASSNLEVRYYRPEQREIAEALAKVVGATIGQSPEKTKVKMLVTSKTLPTGIMEVWLPK
jgi:hypothetical protein